MTSDPFSNILDLIEARSLFSGGFNAGGDWAIRFPPPNKVKLCVIAKGQCWLSLEGASEVIRVTAGDVILMMASRSFVLASDPKIEPRAAEELWNGRSSRSIVVGAGDEFLFSGGHVRMGSESGRLLHDNLPPIIHHREGTSVISDVVIRLGGSDPTIRSAQHVCGLENNHNH